MAKVIKLDPFTRLLSINFSSVMWLSVHAHGLVIPPGGNSKEGSHGCGVTLDPGVAAHSTTENVFESNPYPSPGQEFEQWTLCKFGPPVPKPSYTGQWVRLSQEGEWLVEDTPGLPVIQIMPTTTEIYLYGGNNIRDTSNKQSGLSDKQGFTAQPLAHLLLPNSGRVTGAGTVSFVDILVRIEQQGFGVTIIPG